jgi:heptosyltransferase-1
VSLYGATDPALTGTYGLYQTHLKAEFPCAPCLLKTCKKLRANEFDPPCYATFAVETVWQSLALQISARQRALGV